MGADLHCHTFLSDGSSSVETTVRLAAQSGLSALAITDHDTFAGVETAQRLGESLGIKVIDGVEISAYDYKRKSNVHVLCYLPKNRHIISEICSETLKKRRIAGEIMAQRLSEMYPLSKEDILSYSKNSTTVFKQHMMHALMDAGYSLSVFSNLFFELFKRRGEKYISEPVSFPDVYDVLKGIKEAQGIAIIAHAGFYDNFDLIEELCKQSLIDGVEVWHPQNSTEQRAWLSGFADENSLIKTGGTDFHGMNSNEILPIGTCQTPEEDLIKLVKYSEGC